MSGFVLHPEAHKDLEEIWEHIAADNLEAATAYSKKSTKQSNRSSRFPT